MINRTLIVGDIGGNHNANLGNAMALISNAYKAGFDAVKFQKRNPENYPETPYESQLFGTTTYREHKRQLEFDYEQYKIIDGWCKKGPIDWFASCFDIESVDFIKQFAPEYWKIASPSIQNLELVQYIGMQKGKVFMSTGMSTIYEVDKAVDALLSWKDRQDITILHCCSEYPTSADHINLENIPMYADRYRLSVGYSSHDAGVPASVGAVLLGASVIEVHITLDRAMPGSDHAASLEYRGMETLVNHIRFIEKAKGDKEKHFYEGEKKIRKKVQQIVQMAL